ncbi:hypothetical protein EV363DRAFT_1540609 [Boletus edulis]|nr:hypothetical protein EV363DRAFT_1540609 [Boletus edulis]
MVPVLLPSSVIHSVMDTAYNLLVMPCSRLPRSNTAADRSPYCAPWVESARSFVYDPGADLPGRLKLIPLLQYTDPPATDITTAFVCLAISFIITHASVMISFRRSLDIALYARPTRGGGREGVDGQERGALFGPGREPDLPGGAEVSCEAPEWEWRQGVVGGCAETGEDEQCGEDERRGGGAKTRRAAARLRRLSEDIALWLHSCLTASQSITLPAKLPHMRLGRPKGLAFLRIQEYELPERWIVCTRQDQRAIKDDCLFAFKAEPLLLQKTFPSLASRSARTRGASAIVVPRLVSLLAYTPSILKHGRYAHAKAIIGSEFVGRLADTRVLLVGAGFGHITLLDLDTTDLSNLNRRLLFKKKDVNRVRPCRAQTAGAFNPNVRIQPIHANIKESQFDIEWFHIVLNSLDNLGERIRATTLPLRDLLRARRAPTREQDVHGSWYTACRVGYSWLSRSSSASALCSRFILLPGPPDSTHLSIRIAWSASTAYRNRLQNCSLFFTAHPLYRLGQKLSSSAIIRRGRAEFDEAEEQGENAKTVFEKVNGHTNGGTMKPSSSNGNGGLKDQHALTLRDNLVSCQALRVCAGEETVAFDKDDDDTRFHRRCLKSPFSRILH